MKKIENNFTVTGFLGKDAEISFKDKKITIFARCRRTEGSKCQSVGKRHTNIPRYGDELHQVSGGRTTH